MASLASLENKKAVGKWEILSSLYVKNCVFNNQSMKLGILLEYTLMTIISYRDIADSP